MARAFRIGGGSDQTSDDVAGIGMAAGTTVVEWRSGEVAEGMDGGNRGSLTRGFLRARVISTFLFPLFASLLIRLRSVAEISALARPSKFWLFSPNY